MKIRFVVCVDNSEYTASPEVHKICPVIPDKDAEQEGGLRIIDESRADYLYPARYFVAIEVPKEIERALMEAFERL